MRSPLIGANRLRCSTLVRNKVVASNSIIGMATVTGITGTSLNTQFLNANTLTSTESTILENPVFTGIADFRNVTSFVGYSPLPTGSSVGGGVPIFSTVNVAGDDYTYRFRGAQSTSPVVAATSGPSVTLSLNPATTFTSPQIETLGANTLNITGTVTASELSMDASSTLTAGSFTGFTLDKLDVSNNASPGDLLAANGSSFVRLGGGLNGTYLLANSLTPAGLAWETPSFDESTVINGAAANSLVVSTASTPTYGFFAPPSNGAVRYLRRNPATSSPFLSWENLDVSVPFPSSPADTIVANTVFVESGGTGSGFIYIKNFPGFSGTPDVSATSFYALNSPSDLSSTSTILATSAKDAMVLVGNVGFENGGYSITPDARRASLSPDITYSFTVSDSAGIFPGRTWTFLCLRLRPGRIELGDDGVNAFVRPALVMVLMDNQSAVVSTSPGTQTLSFTIPSLPSAFAPYFVNDGLGNPIPYTSPIGLEPSPASKWTWPYIQWSSPTSMTLRLPSLASSNTVNVPTSGFSYIGANA